MRRSKPWVIPIMAVTAVTVLILLAFQNGRRKHHKDHDLIVRDTLPAGQTAKPELPRSRTILEKQRESKKGQKRFMRGAENVYRETSRRRELLPAGQ